MTSRRVSGSYASALAVLLMVGAVDACSLEGLDRFSFPQCSADGMTGCEPLNARDRIAADACQLWQCDHTGHFCTFAARDFDHDMHIAQSCGGDDCDDHDALAYPGQHESCDGVDNDCNGIVDDPAVGSTPVAEAPQTIVTGASGPTFVSIADANDGVYVLWHSGSETRAASVTDVSAPTPSAVLLGTTNADPVDALTVATSTTGCPEEVVTRITEPPCDASGHCGGSLVCVTPAGGTPVCETPIVHNSPQHAMECQTNAECQDGITCNGIETCDPRGGAMLIDARGCRLPLVPVMSPCPTGETCDEMLDACIMATPTPCAFAEMDAATTGPTELFTVAVTSGRCGQGRIRPGLVDTADTTPSDLLWGDARFDPAWLGVDLDSQGCTGASRAAPALVGASAPSIAALPRDPTVERQNTQALAAWRAVPPGTTGAAPVEILGLWREQSNVAMQTVRFVDASSSGIPLGLPDATTSGHVGLASFSAGAHAGFVVAYARAGGGVSVSVVPALDAPAPPCAVMPVCIQPDVGPDGFLNTSDDAEPVTSVAASFAGPRTTPRLATPVSDVLDTSTTVVGDVTAAIGAPFAGTAIPLALAFATASDVVVARASIDAATGALTDGARIHVAASSPADVRIVHVEAGISLAGQFADATITPGEVGGYVVTWSSPDGTFAARISDHTGALILAGAVRIGPQSDEPRAFVDYDAMGQSPRVRVAAHQGDAFVVFPSVCGPPGP